MSFRTALVGWGLRAALVFLCAYAFLLFWGDASGLLILEGWISEEDILASQNALLLTSLISAVFGALLFCSRWTALASILVCGSAAAVLIARLGSILPRFAENAVRCFVNTVLTNLSDAGYTVLAGYISDVQYAWDAPLLLTAAFCAVGAVLGLLFSVLLMRGVRPVGIALLSAVWLIPVFMYNVTESNKGVMLVIAALTGVVALLLYDRRFGRASEKRLARISRRQTRRAEKKNARLAADAHRKALRLAASDAMIAAYDAGGTRMDAAAAKKEVYRQDKKRKAEEKSAASKKQKTAKVTLSREEKKRIRAEKREAARAERRRRLYNHAGGGFAGAAAAIVALAALAIPHALVDENFPIIQSLDKKIRIARLYATAYLMGDDIDLNSLSIYGGVTELNPRNVSFDSPRFTGERIFSVTSGHSAPVYMRSWIGTDYDLETDTWLSADSDAVNAYRKQFGTSFSSDTVGFNFKKYVYPLTANLDKVDMYRGYANNGFVLSQINIRREGGTGRIMFVPAHLHTDMGIMEYESIEPNKYKVTSYYDGVYSSRFFAIPGRSYSTYAYVTTMKNEELGDVFDVHSAYFKESLTWTGYVDRIEEAIAKGTRAVQLNAGLRIATTSLEEAFSALHTAYMAEMEALGMSWRGDSILLQYMNMSKEERAAYRFAYVLEEEYRAYANETYTAVTGSTGVHKLAMQLLDEAGWKYSPEDIVGTLTDAEGHPVSRHDLVKMVMAYLGSEDFSYSLTPAAPDGTYASNLEAFLFGSKEGYCVHFATAAAAILREYGLAVRYSEGYVASGFKDRRGAAVGDYYTSVYDFNAHAWVEVYYPLMGWVQYEATPAYMSAMYDPDEGYDTSSALPSGDEEPEEEEPEDTEILLPEEEKDYTVLIAAAVCVLILAVIGITLWILLRRGHRFAAARQMLIDAARDREAYYSGTRDNRALAKQLNDMVLGVFSALGIPPGRGELSDAYAARITEEYGELSHCTLDRILTLISKEEFGRGLSYEETVILAEYLEEMSREVYGGLPLFRRFWMRCVRCSV
ncbi:MAG: hypothetical protein E7662_06005 [Ruminococcaceae bacterium]|nr:hypothetical protein [Oscillospiraceae bacterium]